MNSERLLGQDGDGLEIDGLFVNEFDSSKEAKTSKKQTLYESFPRDTVTKSYKTAQGSTTDQK